MKKIIIIFSILLLVITNIHADDSKNVSILFTSDLHSHLLPSVDESGNEYGGYARLMQVINEQKKMNENALLVDAGDFSMGSLFQTAYETKAIELRIMGAMGYDATTLGNHEFDYLPKGLANMLNTAVSSKEQLPYIVDSNYLPPTKEDENYDETDEMMWNAFNNYGVKKYQIIERDGLYYVLFAITGIDSDDCAPNSGMVLEDPVTIAQQMVDESTKECLELYQQEPIVICLSHSGLEDGKGEDYELAKNVEGIDVIVSGHSHTTLDKPIIVNDTYIVACGEYGKNLGVINFSYSNGNLSFRDYKLIPIDCSTREDPYIASLVEHYKQEVNDEYLKDYGMTFDQILLNNQYKFDTTKEVGATQHESTLGNLYADSYKYKAEEVLNEEVDIALTADGVIRDTISIGDVSVSDIFNAASLGVGTEGELAKVYLTGKDLKTVFEIDASVSLLMPSAQLFISGAEYSFNTNRMIFNRVDYAMLRRNDGTLEKIEDDQLYSVVTGMYVGQMLGSVEESSFGLLSVTPRDALGNPLSPEELVNHVIHDSQGKPLKEWYAISSYLLEMDGEMDEKYSHTDGRKVVYSSINPIHLLKNANIFTYALLFIILFIVLIIYFIYKLIKRRKRC